MSKKTRTTVGIVATLVLLAGGAWALGLFGGDDPVVVEMQQRAEQVFGENGTQEDRRAFFEDTRNLTEQQRQQLREWGRPRMQQMFAQRMNEFFSLPKEELQREIAERADRVVAARAQRGDGGGGGGGRGGNMSDAERDARRKQMLDRFDPALRAQFSEFRTMVNDELESRGQDPLSGRDMRSLFGGGRGRPRG